MCVQQTWGAWGAWGASSNPVMGFVWMRPSAGTLHESSAARALTMVGEGVHSVGIPRCHEVREAALVLFRLGLLVSHAHDSRQLPCQIRHYGSD